MKSMKKEEIIFLRAMGLDIIDEQETVTTDSIDRFPNISTFFEEMKRIIGDDMPFAYTSLKESIYISCMIHYTVEVCRKKLISREIYERVLHKAKNLARSIGSDVVVALTLLYEGAYYLHPETLLVFREAGYSRTVESYCDIFGPLMRKVEQERDFSIIYGNEEQAYMDLYRNFMKLEGKNHNR